MPTPEHADLTATQLMHDVLRLQRNLVEVRKASSAHHPARMVAEMQVIAARDELARFMAGLDPALSELDAALASVGRHSLDAQELFPV